MLDQMDEKENWFSQGQVIEISTL